MSKRITKSQGAHSLGQATLLRKTAKAMLVELEIGEEIWIPLSVVHDDSELHDESENGEIGDVVVAEWWWAQRDRTWDEDDEIAVHLGDPRNGDTGVHLRVGKHTREIGIAELYEHAEWFVSEVRTRGYR